MLTYTSICIYSLREASSSSSNKYVEMYVQRAHNLVKVPVCICIRVRVYKYAK